MTLKHDTVTGNIADRGSTSKYRNPPGVGGGLWISWDPTTTVYLDDFTLKHTKSNHPDDIWGPYILVT